MDVFSYPLLAASVFFGFPHPLFVLDENAHTKFTRDKIDDPANPLQDPLHKCRVECRI